ncbi:hypothetical protein M758_10G092300 [Ceratodon purpureus]|nr:hypothetical protein M758_10G092300 [Ceratodon purpureus]
MPLTGPNQHQNPNCRQIPDHAVPKALSRAESTLRLCLCGTEHLAEPSMSSHACSTLQNILQLLLVGKIQSHLCLRRFTLMSNGPFDTKRCNPLGHVMQYGSSSNVNSRITAQ